MTADEVVRQAIAAVKSGKRTLIPGWMNKITIASTRITPRSLVSTVAGSIFAPKDR